jgi:hypothetical protein
MKGANNSLISFRLDGLWDESRWGIAGVGGSKLHILGVVDIIIPNILTIKNE